MRMLRDMEVFVLAADTGSLSAAARRLDMSPAAASLAVKRLEEEVEAPLFLRTTRSLRLTMNGGSDAKRLQALLSPFRNGPCPVRLAYRNGDATAELPLPENWRVRLDDALIKGLADWLAPENVKVIYQ